MKIIKKILGLVKKPEEIRFEDQFFHPILFSFPSILKKSVTIGIDIEDWRKDYLSKNKNVEKYIYEACESLQILGVAYEKYKRDLTLYSNFELNKGMGEVVGRCFEIEARLSLRRVAELFLESWNFAQIAEDKKEDAFRRFFLLKNLRAFYSRKINHEKFCDFSLEFDAEAMEKIRLELEAMTTSLEFYINSDKDFKKDKDLIKIFKSYSQLFDCSITQMTGALRMDLGESYQLYAETSEVIHGFSGGLKFNLKGYHQEMEALYFRTAVLASNVLKNLVVIGKKYIDNDEIIEAIEGLKTDELTEEFMISEGDYVLVRNQIRAKVIKISISQYGCKKYKVEYDDKRGIWQWSFKRQWFLLKELRKVDK